MKADPARKEQTVNTLKGTGTVQMVKNKERTEMKRRKMKRLRWGHFKGKCNFAV